MSWVVCRIGIVCLVDCGVVVVEVVEIVFAAVVLFVTSVFAAWLIVFVVVVVAPST